MSEIEPDVNPGGEPREDDRNEVVDDSPAPDPTDGETGSEDVPEAD
jgi:hypothetical protein